MVIKGLPPIFWEHLSSDNVQFFLFFIFLNFLTLCYFFDLLFCMCLRVSMLALFFVLLCCFSQFYWCCGGVFIFNRRVCVRVVFAVVCVCACSMVFLDGLFFVVQDRVYDVLFICFICSFFFLMFVTC